MPKVIVCLSIESTYRFWFSVLGRIERPRLLRMLRLSTSAGRSVVSARSIASTRSTVSLVTPWPVRMIATSSSSSRSARAISRRLAGERDPVAADVDVRVEGLLDETEVLIAGPEQADHVDAVGNHDGVLGGLRRRSHIG